MIIRDKLFLERIFVESTYTWYKSGRLWNRFIVLSPAERSLSKVSTEAKKRILGILPQFTTNRMETNKTLKSIVKAYHGFKIIWSNFMFISDQLKLRSNHFCSFQNWCYWCSPTQWLYEIRQSKAYHGKFSDIQKVHTFIQILYMNVTLLTRFQRRQGSKIWILTNYVPAIKWSKSPNSHNRTCI